MLTQKTFKTKDSKGCEFECHSQLNTEKQFIDGKIVRVVVDSNYAAMGKSARTLKELQKIVGSL